MASKAASWGEADIAEATHQAAHRQTTEKSDAPVGIGGNANPNTCTNPQPYAVYACLPTCFSFDCCVCVVLCCALWAD